MTEKPEIEDSGTPDNVRRAPRAPHIKADEARVRKYDLNWQTQKILVVARLVLGLGTGALSVWLILLLTWWGITLGVMVACVALFFFWSCWDDRISILAKGRYAMYWDSDRGGHPHSEIVSTLIGGVVLSTEPTMAITLANVDTSGKKVYKRFNLGGREISSEEYRTLVLQRQAEWNEKWESKYMEAEMLEADRMLDHFWDSFFDRYTYKEDLAAGKWVCLVVKIGEGDWSLKAGDRIPCGAAYDVENQDRELWMAMQVIPLIWGTDDTEELRRCAEAVSEYEWMLLAEIAPLAGDLKEDEMYLIHRSKTTPGNFRFQTLNDKVEEDEKDADAPGRDTRFSESKEDARKEE